MWLADNNNDAMDTREWEQRMVMQKEIFPVNDALGAYLKYYGLDKELPVLYPDLANYSYANSIRDKKGKWTHWENAVYEPEQLAGLKKGLLEIYAMLKSMPATQIVDLFDIERIDFCDYGNSIPFRVKVVSLQRAPHDFFYVKQADASRIYGLELERLLTHHPINFIYHRHTLVEDHIEGVPGDVFIQQESQLTQSEKTAIAHSFVRFNESCFVRLLGDMRAYNFVVATASVDKTADERDTTAELSGSGTRYYVRAIDFDQQCYEGRKVLYFPRFYKENLAYVELVEQNLSTAEIEQSRQQEFTSMAASIVTYRRPLMELLNSMVNDDISEHYKINILKKELNDHFGTTRFTSCKTMGSIVKQQLKQILQKHVQQVHTK